MNVLHEHLHLKVYFQGTQLKIGNNFLKFLIIHSSNVHEIFTTFLALR